MLFHSCFFLSLSASTLSCSSGSSRGSLTSSRGSLVASSLGSQSSLSFTDAYLEHQSELSDPDFQVKLDSLLHESTSSTYRPSSSIPTIHENEVTAGPAASAAGQGACLRAHTLRLSETPRSMSSLSPRSSLSSLSPPCSPLVPEASSLVGETFSGSASQLDLELQARLSELSLQGDAKQDANKGTVGDLNITNQAYILKTLSVMDRKGRGFQTQTPRDIMAVCYHVEVNTVFRVCRSRFPNKGPGVQLKESGRDVGCVGRIGGGRQRRVRGFREKVCDQFCNSNIESWTFLNNTR